MKIPQTFDEAFEASTGSWDFEDSRFSMTMETEPEPVCMLVYEGSPNKFDTIVRYYQSGLVWGFSMYWDEQSLVAIVSAVAGVGTRRLLMLAPECFSIFLIPEEGPEAEFIADLIENSPWLVSVSNVYEAAKIALK
jgi:hypothetical protein